MACRKRRSFIDGRVFVTGDPSVLNLHNPKEIGILPPKGLTNQVLAKCSNQDFHVNWVDVNSLVSSALTFENGLTLSSSTATLGGPLTQNTNISGVGTYGVNFSDLLDFTLVSTGLISATSASQIDLTAGTNFNIVAGAILDLEAHELILEGTSDIFLQPPSYNTAQLGSFVYNQDPTSGQINYSTYSLPVTSGNEGEILVVDANGNLVYGTNSSTVDNTVFVMKTGDDSTGTRERLDLPFLTVEAAVAAAQTGDLVVVHPGQFYEAANATIMKPYISMELKAGADIIVPDVTSDSVFQLEGEVSITGPGRITLSAPTGSYTSFKVGNPVGSRVTIDISILKLTRVSLDWQGLESLDMNINELDATDCSVFRTRAGLSSTSYKIRIGFVSVNNANQVVAPIEIEGQQTNLNTFDIELGKVECIAVSNITGFIMLTNNSYWNTIKIYVNDFRFANPTSAANVLTPLIRATVCSAQKDIKFNNFRHTGLLTYPQTYNGSTTSPERGSIEFSGVITDNVHNQFLTDILSFRRKADEVHYHLNIVDENTHYSLGVGGSTIVSLASPTGSQKLSGYFKTLKSGVPTNDPFAAFGYGNTNGNPITTTATIDNLTVVCGTGFPSFRRTSNDASLSVAGVGIPNRNSMSNSAVDPVNSGPVFLIDTSLTVDNAVR